MVMIGGSFKSRFSGVLLGGASLLLATVPGVAGGLKDEAPAGDAFAVSGWVGVTSDYVFRGLSFNRREPTAQAQLDVSYGIAYFGVFASGVDFNDKLFASFPNADVEVDLYGGIKPKWRDVTFDFGVIGYMYTDKDRVGAKEQDYLELKAGASITVFKDLALGGTFFYSPDGQNTVGGVYTVEGTVSKPLYSTGPLAFAASGTVGWVGFEESVDPFNNKLNEYVYYNAGITTTINEKFSIDVRYWGTDLDRAEVPAGISAFQAGDAVSVTGKVSF